VNTVRYQLKGSGDKETAQTKEAETKEAQESENKDIPIKYNSQWKEIIRTMNTQKAVTTVSQNRYDQVIISLRCSEQGYILSFYIFFLYKTT